MPTLSTYISLPGNTREALEHYRDVFGGELDIMRYSDAPPMEGMPFEPDPNAVAHATLTLPGGTITGGDQMPGEEYNVQGSIYSLLYTLDDADEARGFIQQLVDAGGTVAMPFELAPWGGYYGQVFDQFGIMWSFDVAANQG